ncbi:MAG: IS1595 family transposase [Bacteroidota bacterium]
MNFLEFARKYSDEESCKALFKAYRDKVGVICRKCGSLEHYWQRTIDHYQCKKCGTRTTLRSGTVMESSNLSYKHWVYGIFLMTMTKKGISALELQRQLGLKRYQPAWEMMHKLRAAMGNRDSKYKLDEVIEADDAFFKSQSDEGDEEKDGNGSEKRGRGSSQQGKVLVLSKTVPKVGRPKKHKKRSSFRYVKMLHIEDSGSEEINEKTKGAVSSDSRVTTDGWAGFNRLRQVVDRHVRKVIPPSETSKELPWVHTMISNAKRKFLGINHNNINQKYLQNYLNEFCYVTNRRYFGKDIFDRLMVTAVEDAWYGKLVYDNG